MRIQLAEDHSYTEDDIKLLEPLLGRDDLTLVDLATCGVLITLDGYYSETDTLVIAHPYAW